MDHPRSWQLHANVNGYRNDVALRITITAYDDDGFEIDSKTWRRHVSSLWMDGLDWTALLATRELEKLMAHHLETEVTPTEIDEPLF